MKWHLFQFESQLYLSTSLEAVTNHITQYHDRESYQIKQLSDNTMVKTHEGLFSLEHLTKKMKAYAKRNGYNMTNNCSIYVRHGKAVTISHEMDEIMA